MFVATDQPNKGHSAAPVGPPRKQLRFTPAEGSHHSLMMIITAACAVFRSIYNCSTGRQQPALNSEQSKRVVCADVVSNEVVLVVALCSFRITRHRMSAARPDDIGCRSSVRR